MTENERLLALTQHVVRSYFPAADVEPFYRDAEDLHDWYYFWISNALHEVILVPALDLKVPPRDLEMLRLGGQCLEDLLALGEYALEQAVAVEVLHPIFQSPSFERMLPFLGPKARRILAEDFGAPQLLNS